MTSEESGFVPLFDGRTLAGWELARGDLAHWAVDGDEVRCGNSGVFARSLLEGRPAYNGVEFQILDDHGTPPSLTSTGSIYDAVAPSGNLARPAGAWNDVEITCAGGRVVFVLNGERVVDVDLDADESLRGRPREGYLGLQNHASAVAFRNVRVKEL